MSGADRRRRERDLRASILEAARALFVEHGYDAVTMRKIAERIEYSPTAIYQHFTDKQSLMQELCALDFTDMADCFGRLAAVADPLERLRRMAEEYIRFASSNPNHYRFLFMTSRPEPSPLRSDTGSSRMTRRASHDSPPAEPDECGRPGRDWYGFLRWTLSQAAAQGRLRPELSDPDLCAQVAWGAIHGAVALELAMAGEDWADWRPMDRLAQVMLDTLIRGITPAAESGPGSPR